ncbi:hypothetical protein HNY73_016567 [Argiope bruennichi]|uniref:Uncharacterized protein n=1 Tax=Argiope bruennichi TaxID=94029 RepID=A0A8T0EJ69_ARGBR|nr:hypothetical protein HNY73_016567 [Argiope bruennichi]
MIKITTEQSKFWYTQLTAVETTNVSRETCLKKPRVDDVQPVENRRRKQYTLIKKHDSEGWPIRPRNTTEGRPIDYHKPTRPAKTRAKE